MAITKQVNIVVKESGAEKVNQQMDNLAKSFTNASSEIKDIKKSTDIAKSGLKFLEDGFKNMWFALKAIGGISLVMEAFNMFKEVLSKNQKVVDLFNTAIGALSIAFNDLIGFVMDNFPSVVKIFKDVFENPTKYLQKFGDLIKENLIERFNSLLDTVGYLGSALKKVFEGDFAGAMDSVKQAGKESIDILTGVNNTVDRSKKAIGDAAEAIGNYAVNTYKASGANIKLQNSALLASAEQARLVEVYDRQAEKLRQIRDNDLISIDDRIKANNELKDVLEKQQTAMIDQANLQVSASKRAYEMNKTIENQVAVTNALANKEGVLAQVEGLRSEQISNSISLQKEKIALGQSEVEGMNALTIQQKKFTESLERDSLKKLEIQRANLEQEKRIELERLQLKKDTAVAGTQAKIDADLEYANKKQELDNALTEIGLKVDEEKLKKDLEKKDRDIENQNIDFKTRLEKLGEEQKAINESTFLSEEEKSNRLREIGERRLEVEKQQNDARYQSARNIGDALSSLTELLGGKSKKAQALGKAITLAQIGIDTAQAISNAIPASVKAGQEAGKVAGPAAAVVTPAVTASTYIGLAAMIAGNALKAKNLLSGGGAGGGSSTGGAMAPQAPSFNLVQGTGRNQLAESIGQQAPVKAFVVARDMSTGQEMDRNIIKSASL